MAEQHNVLNVINPAEGKRYKVTLRGDISALSARKLKRYLVASCGIDAHRQLLKYNGVELGDDVLAGEVGISSGATLTVERRAPSSAPYVASPAKQALELQTLDQQRELLGREHQRREDAFKKQQEALQASLALAEQRRSELERDKEEKERELQRLRDLEDKAAQERARLEEVRRAEAEREALRARDLEARKEQLSHERMQQRQLEMMRLENERKKMLLEQQRAEYEGERARLERERKERQERIKRQELLIKEREVDLERAAVDAERQRRQLAYEREVLEQQRVAEMEHLNATAAHQQSVTGTPAASTGLARTPIRAGATPYLTPARHNATAAGAGAAREPSMSNGSAASSKAAELAALRREKEALRQQREAAAQERTEEEELDRQIAAERAEIDALRSGTSSKAASAVPSAQPSGAFAPRTETIDVDTDTPDRARAGETGDAAHSEETLRRLAVAQLEQLAEDLGVPTLALDDNNTCVVSIEDRYTLLITFDPTTARVYLYSTLSTFIPKSPDAKLRLYEFLLEGALLGRDMCGGGVGVSLKNDFVLLSTSVYLPKASRTALRSITPTFVETLVKWRSQVRDVLADDGASGVMASSISGPHAMPAQPQQQQQFQYQQVQSHGSTSAARASVSAAHGASTSAARGGSSVPNAYIPDDTFDETAGSVQQQQQPQPVLGIEVTEDDDHRGVIVLKVRGPAARAGILANDVIRKVDGAVVTTLRDFQRVVRELRPNTAVPFVVERARTQLMVNVLVGSTGRSNDPRYGVVTAVPAAGVADGGSSRHRGGSSARGDSVMH